jgi:nuclease S1
MLTPLLTMLGATSAWAWGDTGHEIVCEIAFQGLSEHARREVIRLIRKDSQFHTFRQSCIWPDHPRQRAEEHFVNVPRDFVKFTADNCPIADKCVLTAIRADFERLKNGSDDDEKLAALKFLGHWVGDMHQPLHVAFKDDRGGNNIKADGVCADSLHSVWDICIIERAFGTDAEAAGQQSFREITDEQRRAWQSSQPFEWANQSLDIARSPNTKYCVQVGNECRYDVDRATFQQGGEEKTVTIDQQYLDLHGPMVKQRLQQAGVRLAQMLNQALDEAP